MPKSQSERSSPSNFQMNDSPSYSSDVQNSGRILEFDTKTPGTEIYEIPKNLIKDKLIGGIFFRKQTITRA